MIGFRLFSLLAAATFELEVIASEVEDVSQGIQDQRVHVVSSSVLFVVVPYRKDAAHLQSDIRTELLHLSDRDTKQEVVIADPIQLSCWRTQCVSAAPLESLRPTFFFSPLFW